MGKPRAKVFISWAGDRNGRGASDPDGAKRGRKIAESIKRLIERILPVETFLSSNDLTEGKMWLPELLKALADATCAIVCITRKNYNSTWMMFEAGALIMAMRGRGEERFVIPLLLEKGVNIASTPYASFQHVKFQQEEGDFNKAMLATLNAINKACKEADCKYCKDMTISHRLSKSELELTDLEALCKTEDGTSPEDTDSEESGLKFGDLQSMFSSYQAVLDRVNSTIGELEQKREVSADSSAIEVIRAIHAMVAEIHPAVKNMNAIITKEAEQVPAKAEDVDVSAAANDTPNLDIF